MNKNYCNVKKKSAVLVISVFLILSCTASEYQKKLKTIFTAMNIPTEKKIMNAQSEFLVELESLLRNDTDILLILADKKHLLPETYAPNDLIQLEKNNLFSINRNDLSVRRATFEALQKMSQAALQDGITLLVSSTYRSYAYQKTVYERNVRQLGKAEADRESAAPGTSQHQLGTVIDFGSITDEFAQTKQGRWILANAGKYGFSLSFPNGYEEVTGYRWESWHYRYIGKEAVTFQKKWFDDIQQYMLEFIDAWKR